MNSSLFFQSLYTTRFLLVVLTFFGYRGLDKGECVAVQECATSDVAGTSQPVQQPLQNLATIDDLCNKPDDPDIDRGSVIRNYVTPMQEHGRMMIQKMKENNGNSDAPVSAHPGDLSDLEVMEFMQTVFDDMLSENYPWLCMVHRYLRTYANNTGDVSTGDSTLPTYVDGESIHEAIPLIIEQPEEFHMAREHLDDDDSSDDEDEYVDAVTSTGWMQSVRNAFNSAKDFLVGSDKDPKNPVPSLPQRIRGLGTWAITATATKAASVVSSISDGLGIKNDIASKLKGYLATKFGVDPSTIDPVDPISDSYSDESCFQDKLTRMNAFYLNNVDLYSSKTSGYVLYGLLPDSVDVTHATPPFRTMNCSTTSSYVIVSTGDNTTSHTSSFLVALFMA